MTIKKYAEKITEKTGCETRLVKWRDGEYVKDCIIVNTDYEGMYAPKETFELINEVRNMVKRSRGKYEIKYHAANVCCYVMEV